MLCFTVYKVVKSDLWLSQIKKDLQYFGYHILWFMQQLNTFGTLNGGLRKKPTRSNFDDNRLSLCTLPVFFYEYLPTIKLYNCTYILLLELIQIIVNSIL